MAQEVIHQLYPTNKPGGARRQEHDRVCTLSLQRGMQALHIRGFLSTQCRQFSSAQVGLDFAWRGADQGRQGQHALAYGPAEGMDQVPGFQASEKLFRDVARTEERGLLRRFCESALATPAAATATVAQPATELDRVHRLSRMFWGRR